MHSVANIASEMTAVVPDAIFDFDCDSVLTLQWRPSPVVAAEVERGRPLRQIHRSFAPSLITGAAFDRTAEVDARVTLGTNSGSLPTCPARHGTSYPQRST